MQKETPESIKSHFDNTVKPTAEATLNRRVNALPESLQARYQITLDQQARDLRNLEKELAETRDEKIASKTQEIRDQWEHERSPELKPKYLPSVSNEELALQAREQACVQIEIEENQKFQERDEAHYKVRYEFVLWLEIEYATHTRFNEIARITIEPDRGEDHER